MKLDETYKGLRLRIRLIAGLGIENNNNNKFYQKFMKIVNIS